jgi:outer membrane protein TolC
MSKTAIRTYSALSVIALGLMAPGVVRAQETPAQQPPAQPPTQPPAKPPTSVPQPSAKTPPTPLPKEKPDTDRFGVKGSDIKPTTTFQGQTPGQPLPGDPTVIRNLDDALKVAFERSPALLQAKESAVRTEKTVDQILALRKPSITVAGSYTRLSGAGAAFGGGGGGITPGQVTNPFPVGLQFTPPGSAPVTLANSVANTTIPNSTTGGNLGATVGGVIGGSVGASAPGVTGQTRSTPVPGSTIVTRQTDDGDDDDNGNGGGGGNIFGNGVNLNQYSVRGGINQFIDITGVIRTAIQVGDLQKALTRLEIIRNRQDVALTVRNAYYNLLRSEAFVRVNEAAVEQSQELLRVTEVQKTAGVVAEFDVLRARTQLENNRQALISSRNQVAIAKNALANTIGVDPSTPVETDSPTVPPMPTLDEQALVDTAFKQRPEYFLADINYLKAQKGIRLARRNLEPYLNASLSGTYNPSPALGNEPQTGALSLTLTVPIWDGGATKAQVEAARSDERGALIQKDQFVRGIKAEVQQAIISVRDANERAEAATLTVTQAREALRLAGVRYRAGVGTQLDVNDAQTALTQAETNFVNAQFDYLSALARLSRAVGNPE